MLLHEAENLIQVTRLLSEESLPKNQASEHPTPWATNASPQLAPDWVDVLNKTSDAAGAAVWQELTAILPHYEFFIVSWM
jgi:hypothetical protein